MKRLNKLTTLFFTISGIILLQNCFTAVAVRASSNDNNDEIITYSYDIEWRYKLINGKLYKRQYNHTTKKWIGNWIPA